MRTKPKIKTKLIGSLLLLLFFQVGCSKTAPTLNEPHSYEPFSSAAHFEKDPSILMAGVYKEEITPPIGTPLGGYGRRRGRPSTGVHDPLYVRALALKDATDILIFASCDLVAVDENLYQTVFEKVSQKMPLKNSQLLVFATHTHSGAGAIGKGFLAKLIMGRYDTKVFNMTVDRITDAILQAVSKMKPASVGLGESQLEGMIENRMIEGGPVDSELKVLRVEVEGKPLAFLVNLAAHPTVLNAQNFLFSADFPGFLDAKVESAYPDSVCLFANGAAGDQRVQGFAENQAFDRAKAIGDAIGKRVIGIVRSIPLKERGEVVTLQTDIHLPPVKIRRDFLVLPSWIGNRFLNRNVVMNVASLNDILFISIPGEMTGELGLEIKREAEQAKFKPLILGYANGYMGYIVPEKYYNSKTYEASVTFFGPKLDRYFKQAASSGVHFLEGVRDHSLREARQ